MISLGAQVAVRGDDSNHDDGDDHDKDDEDDS